MADPVRRFAMRQSGDLRFSWRYRRWADLCCLVVICIGMGGAPLPAEVIPDIALPIPSSTPATLSFPELREGMIRSIRSIRALDAEFTHLVRLASTNPSAAEVIPYTFNREAHKGEQRYKFHRTLQYPHRDDLTADIAAKPGFNEYVRVFDGKDQRYYSEFSSRGGILGVKDLSADWLAYPLALGIIIIDDLRAMSKEDKIWAGWPPDVYEGAGLEWKVESLCETVDGVTCHVIRETSLGSRKWIDPEAGFAVRFFEKRRRDPTSGAMTTEVDLRSSHSDLRKVAPGIWLPYQLVTVKYARPLKGSTQSNIVEDRHDIIAVRLCVNDDVPDSLFKLDFPPGTIVSDEIRGVSFTIGKNGEELDQVIAAAQEILDADGSRRTSNWVWVNMATIAAILLAISVRFIRRQSSKS